MLMLHVIIELIEFNEHNGLDEVFVLVSENQGIPFLEKFVATRGAALNNVTDNVWQLIKRDFEQLVIHPLFSRFG